MRSVRGKIVVITGAASGIGAALATSMAAQGARLMLADIDAAGLESLGATLRLQGCDCHTWVTDTGNEAAIYALAAQAEQRFGAVDILINNAGVGLVAPVDKLPTADAHWLMNINFWGVVHGCQAFLPLMRKSPDAVVSVPTQSIYNASKAAVRAFSDGLREELRGSNVEVLCVHPGGIKTNIANNSRIVDVSLIADSAQEMRDNFSNLARTTPQQAAAVIVHAIERGKTRVLIGADAKIMDWIFRLFPASASRWTSALGQHLRAKSQASKALAHQ
jgi:short-subunit dehydrogenase